MHDVGYRQFLPCIAESLEIERFFADNVYVDGKQAVEVLVEDEDENAEVEDVDVRGVRNEDKIVLPLLNRYAIG